jgi:transcriptional regulator with XRE-family HTH domain
MSAWRFDPTVLARTLTARRQALGWSTRDLAQRSGLSQAYVVTLERPARRPDAVPRVPTVVVLGQLAEALGLTPHQLHSRVVRPIGRHALLVYDDRRVDPVAAAQQAITAGGGVPPARWVATCESPHGHHRIDLRPEGAGDDDVYDPERIERAVTAEFERHAIDLNGEVALLVTQQSPVIAAPRTRGELLSFERRWADAVHERASDADVVVGWNICAYRASDLRAAGARATRMLEDAHDLVWVA